MRLAGIDLGRVRLGLALGIDGVAVPFRVLQRHGTRRDIAELLPIFDKQGTEAVVVGLPPVQDDANAGTSGLARRFAQALAAATVRPVWLVDEADTTVEANAELRALGMRAARRRAEVDRHAAARIVDRFLGGAPAERVPPPAP